jgi:hypothetical protein
MKRLVPVVAVFAASLVGMFIGLAVLVIRGLAAPPTAPDLKFTVDLVAKGIATDCPDLLPAGATCIVQLFGKGPRTTLTNTITVGSGGPSLEIESIKIAEPHD